MVNECNDVLVLNVINSKFCFVFSKQELWCDLILGYRQIEDRNATFVRTWMNQVSQQVAVVQVNHKLECRVAVTSFHEITDVDWNVEDCMEVPGKLSILKIISSLITDYSLRTRTQNEVNLTITLSQVSLKLNLKFMLEYVRL